MHFDVLVEDLSGRMALEILIPKIIGSGHAVRVSSDNRKVSFACGGHTVCVSSYRGIGRLPKNKRLGRIVASRKLLNKLPNMLKGLGKTHASYPPDYPAVVVVVCDLDDKCRRTFLNELHGMLDGLPHKPETHFCLAIEEGEAWLLGDLPAVATAYCNAKMAVLNAYVPDSICGTWEVLADAVFMGGAEKLKKLGPNVMGAEKSQWAQAIAPHMTIAANKSPSFAYFCRKLRDLAN